MRQHKIKLTPVTSEKITTSEDVQDFIEELLRNFKGDWTRD